MEGELKKLEFIDIQILIGGVERKIFGLIKDGRTKKEIKEIMEKEVGKESREWQEFVKKETELCLRYSQAS